MIIKGAILKAAARCRALFLDSGESEIERAEERRDLYYVDLFKIMIYIKKFKIFQSFCVFLCSFLARRSDQLLSFIYY